MNHKVNGEENSRKTRRKMIRVTVWNEYKHEREYEGVRKVYPQGIHGCIASF